MLLNWVEKQQEELRKVNEEGEPYKHLATRQDGKMQDTLQQCNILSCLLELFV
jgi:hypothetical protein